LTGTCFSPNIAAPKFFLTKEQQFIMSMLAFIILAVAAGFCLPTQAGINAQLNLWCRSPVLAAAISFAVGTLSLVVYGLIIRVPWPAGDTVVRYPWWIWSGGVLGAFFVASCVFLAPRLGAAPMVGLIVTGQMLTSILLDHFGWLSYELHPISALRMLGVVFLIGGVVLIRLF